MSANAGRDNGRPARQGWQQLRGHGFSPVNGPMNTLLQLLRRFKAPLFMALAVSVVLSAVAAATLVLLGDWWRERGAGEPLPTRLALTVLTVASVLALWLLWHQAFALAKQRLIQHELQRAVRERLELEVAQRTTQLTALALHLETAHEDERARLARDLHDELGALLTSAKLDVARIKARLGASAPEAQERLAHLVGTLNEVIALKRSITEDLRPSSLAQLGLTATLEIQAREFAERSGLVVHTDVLPVSLTPAAELIVFRLVQEAITNITKHARAKQVWVTVAPQGQRVSVSVRDDGVGFDPLVPLSASHGLIGMRFRIEAEGGTLALQSSAGNGTLIQVSLPALAAAAGSALSPAGG